MMKVTDPELLRQLNAPDASESSGGEDASGLKKVTDPKLLAMLNEDDAPEKTAPSKMPRPTLPSLKDVAHDGWWSFLGMKSPTRESSDAFVQSVANTGIGLADLVPGVNIQPIKDWSTSDSVAAKVGGLAGDLAGFGVGAGGVSAASKLPKVEAGLKNLYSMIPEFSHKAAIAEKLSSPLAKTVAGNAAFGAVLDPEHQLEGAGTGALLGAAGHGAGKLLGTSDPALKAAGGGLIGAALGYPVGEITGIGGAHGAEAGMAIGAGATLWPSSGKRAIANVLGNANPKEMGTRRQNAKDLGYTHQTPAEATGNPFDIGIESKIGESKQGLVPLWKYKKGGAAEQKKIIGDFVDDVSPAMDAAESVRGAAKQNIKNQAKERLSKSDPLYEKAGRDTIPTEQLKIINDDKNLNARLQQTINDPRNVYDLGGYEPNSVKVLETMRQDLAGEIQGATKKGDYNDARKLRKQLNILDNVMDNSGDNIRAARAKYAEESIPVDKLKEGYVGKIAKMKDPQLKNVSRTIFDTKQTDITKFKEIRDAIYKENPKAWRGIIRNEIERRLAPTEGGGSDFYKQILKNQNSYDQMVEATKVLGGNSSKKLAQMRDVFETLIDPKTGKAIYDEARIGGASIKPGGILHQLVKFGDGVINGRYNKAATELITNPRWDEESSKIALVKNKEERAMRYAKLMARIANAELND